ncbi:hypothetical protein ACLSYZ_11185, partial [Avibacterium avium]|uniref:hypothetical protein n=1 Tax=Avibacterium TaxID=292486 RepID=UPI0039FBC601
GRREIARTGQTQTGNLRDYDNIADRETIMLGIQLFRMFSISKVDALSANDVLQGLEKISDLDDARVIHLCFDKSNTKFTKI